MHSKSETFDKILRVSCESKKIIRFIYKDTLIGSR